MKTFSQWVSESAPANVSAGIGVRGLGDVTGNPAGDITNYAAANAAEQARITAELGINTSDGVIGYEGGDTKDQILKPGRVGRAGSRSKGE